MVPVKGLVGTGHWSDGGSRPLPGCCLNVREEVEPGSVALQTGEVASLVDVVGEGGQEREEPSPGMGRGEGRATWSGNPLCGSLPCAGTVVRCRWITPRS